MAAIVAHRGAWKQLNLPQNSIASLRQAAVLGCAGSEFDIRLTSDGVPVVNHNSNYYGLKIELTKYSELSQHRHPNGETISTLEEYLHEGVKTPGMKMIAEIKTSPLGTQHSRQSAEKVVALVQELNAQAQVDYISFNYRILREILVLDSHARVAYLRGDKTPAQIKNEKFSGADYPYQVFRLFPHWISRAHKLGLTVNAWTVNNAAAMRFLLKAKADFITTDEPELLQQIVG